MGATEEKVDLVLILARFSTTVTVTTANRREELLLNTAEPTTVIDQVQILDTGARNAKDLLNESHLKIVGFADQLRNSGLAAPEAIFVRAPGETLRGPSS